MTNRDVRDTFASSALQAILFQFIGKKAPPPKELASAAFELADAMMIESAKFDETIHLAGRDLEELIEGMQTIAPGVKKVNEFQYLLTSYEYFGLLAARVK